MHRILKILRLCFFGVTMLFVLFQALVWGVALVSGCKEMQVCINHSKSLPETLFLCFEPKEKPGVGSYVVFDRHDHQVIKKIMGMPGDQIEVNDRLVSVAGKKHGIARERSRSGRQYTLVEAGVIPEGFCYVGGTHIDSYDSRYREFGLVWLEEITAVAWPIF